MLGTFLQDVHHKDKVGTMLVEREWGKKAGERGFREKEGGGFSSELPYSLRVIT